MRELRIRLDEDDHQDAAADGEFEEYVLLDPPLACCHNKLVDPSELIRSVREDYQQTRRKCSAAKTTEEEEEATDASIQRQFALDFPRLKMFINGEELLANLTPVQVQKQLTNTFMASPGQGKGKKGRAVGDRAAARRLAKEVILLATQGTLAPVFQWASKLCADRDNGVHVTSGGHQQVHVQTHAHHEPPANSVGNSRGGGAASVEVFVMKPLQVISIEEGEAIPLTDLMCQLRLVLAPWTGGEMTLCVPHRHHTVRGSAVAGEAVSVDVPLGGTGASPPLMAMTAADTRTKASGDGEQLQRSWVVL
eukprot:g1870.t1